MGKSTAAIVWGIPVHLMKFLHNLEAFRTAVPTIHTLRLCNQFGTGENAGITKLPKELIGFIEEALLAMHRRRDRNRSLAWTSTYRCYEGACRTREHGVHVNFEIYADSSEDDGLYQESDSDSEMDGGEYVWEICWEQKAQWQDDLRKHMEDNGNGDFLRKHFGLEVFIMHEILDSDTTKYLKRTNQRYHFRSGPEKATICYLVLPYQNALWETHFDPMCEGSDCYYGESATSMLVDRSSLNLTEEHQRRFARAMRRLALKPSVHPSQLQDVLSATSAISYCPSPEQTTSSASNKDLPEKGNEEEDLATTRRINNLEQSQWPKLMLLSDQIYSEP